MAKQKTVGVGVFLGALGLIALGSSAVLAADSVTMQQNVEGTVPYVGAGKSPSGAVSSTALGLRVNGAEMMRLTATGSLGVGTTSPAATAEIKGDLKLGTAVRVCGASLAGTVQWTNTALQLCDGTAWKPIKVGADDSLLAWY